MITQPETTHRCDEAELAAALDRLRERRSPLLAPIVQAHQLHAAASTPVVDKGNAKSYGDGTNAADQDKGGER